MIDLDEKATNLIREHMHITLLLPKLVESMNELNESRQISLKDAAIMITKALGRYYRERLQDVKKELRTLGISTWIEDQGDMIYINVATRGAKERFGVKRKMADEEIQAMMEGFADKLERNPPEFPPYKVEMERPKWQKMY